LTADVLVVGGGLVGGTLACALAQHGISAIAVDREGPDALLETGYDGRSSAIAGACQRVLEAVGIWDHMKPDVQPILDIRVTDSDSPFFLHYDHTDVGEAMGWMAENRTIRRGIFARVAELDKATLVSPAELTSLTRGPDGVEAVLNDGRVIRASLVVAADGRRSWVRDQAGIPISTLPYHQSGIVMTVHHQQNHHGIAHERFLASGPFAILPLPGGHHSSLVWTEKDSLIQPLLALPPDQFHAELMSRFGDFLGEVTVVSKVFAYPLTLQVAKTYVSRRLVLVGDAAHGMHPVAGQGMNYGLRDVAALVETLVEAKRLGLDLGSPQPLLSYERWRRPDNLLMLGMTDAIVRLFSNDVKPLRFARSLGLAAVNKMPNLKVFFMRHAMGDVGRLPRLMKGETC
jgi:2-octaprenyl-6-methoxyphenol hydroxylase